MKKINITDAKLKEFLKISEEIAYEAGKKLLKYSKKLDQLTITHKEAEGVASNADVETEKFIISRLLKKYPTHEVLAEEDCYKEQKAKDGEGGSSDFLWIIDPLDGTHNFLNGFNYYAVCISLAYKGKPITGVVYRPSTGECFKAYKGGGAFYKENDKARFKKIHQAKNPKALKESIFSTGFATEKGMTVEQEFFQFKSILKNSRAVRRLGSAALDLCYTASGVFDGFWERFLSPWDVAASGLIAMEAGVKVTDFDGRAFSPFDKTILGARTPLYNKIRKLLNGVKS